MITTDAFRGILKSVYPRVKRASMLAQTSTELNKVPIHRWEGGKELRFSLSNGSAASGSNYQAILAAGMTYTDLNKELVVDPRYITAFFEVDMPQQLTTKAELGAYQDVVSDRMSKTFDTLNRLSALHFYNGARGVLMTAPTKTLVTTGNVITVPTQFMIGLKVNDTFRATTTEDPASTLMPGRYTITGKQGNQITFSSTATDAWTGVENLVLDFCLNSDGVTVNAPDGLADIIPSWYGRAGANWTSYINTPYRSINRSISVSEYAGHFSSFNPAAAGAKWAFEIQRMLLRVKTYGFTEGDILLSNGNYQNVAEELQLYGQFNNLKPTTNEVTQGITRIGMAHNELIVPHMWEDGLAPDDKIYFVPAFTGLNAGDGIYDMGATERVFMPQQQLGKASPTDVGTQGFGDEIRTGINLRNLFTVTEGGAGDFGPQLRIAAHLYNNLVIRDTSKCGVIQVSV